LNSLSSQAMLNSNLAQLSGGYTDFEDAGQILNYTLQIVSSPDFMAANNGYRSGISNHVLIYLTTTTAFDTDPTPAAQTILAQKQYGIITIGYGGATDNNKLQTISGGSACSFTAPDFASLNNQIKTIQQLILNA
ncbi:VWA domain-containing protein, partial [Escherichia coli]|nr:VWA domain-containing protein [Escherichia coli]